MSSRVFLAGLFHETNTFSGTSTPLEEFQIWRGDELFGALGNSSPMDGFLSTAADYGWEIVPGVDYRAQPSGMPEEKVFEHCWSELQPRLDEALNAGLDAIFLILHGAMSTENFPDVEGELLRRIRSRPGAETLPLFAVLDLHANVSEQMARQASALIPYRENPHTDARETAVRAARLLRLSLTSRKSLQTHFLSAGVLLAPPSTGTAASPMRDLAAAARNLEQSAGHWEVGIAAGFAHSDTPDTGLSFWVVSDQPEISCLRSLESLYSLARSLTREQHPTEWPLSTALDWIAKERKFPALLVEPADNIGGGAPGDAKFLLRALLERPIGSSGVILCDPGAVQSLQGKTPGETVKINLGGNPSLFEPEPLELDVVMERLTDGTFDLEDKQSHLASMAGTRIAMGPSAVVTHRHITILLTSRATPPFDLGQWRSQGVEPEKLDIITVKAAVGHKRAYDPIAASSYTVSTPGPCASDLTLLPFQRLRRPIYPLDA